MGNTEVRMSEDPRQLEGTPAEPGRPEGHNARQRLGLLALSVLSALVFAGALAYAIGGGLLSVGGEDIGQRERRDLPREWTNLIPLRPVGPELVAGLGRGRDASEVAGSSDQSERGQRGRDERGQRGRDAGRDGSPTTARLGPIPGALATRLPRPRVVTVIGPLALPRLPGVVELVPSLPQLPEITPGVDPIPGKGVDIPPGGLFPGGLPRPPTGLPIPGGLPRPPTGLPIPGGLPRPRTVERTWERRCSTSSSCVWVYVRVEDMARASQPPWGRELAARWEAAASDERPRAATPRRTVQFEADEGAVYFRYPLARSQEQPAGVRGVLRRDAEGPPHGVRQPQTDGALADPRALEALGLEIDPEPLGEALQGPQDAPVEVGEVAGFELLDDPAVEVGDVALPSVAARPPH